MGKRKMLGALLVEHWDLEPAGLALALRRQAEWRARAHDPSAWPLGRVLCKLGLSDPVQIATALAHRAGVKLCRLSLYEIAADVIASVPREVAIRWRMIPLKQRKRDLVVGLGDAPDASTLCDLRFIVGQDLEVVVCPDDAISEGLAKYYSHGLDPDPLRIASVAHLLRIAALRAEGPIHLQLRPERVRLRCAWSGAEHDHELILDRAGQEVALMRLNLGEVWKLAGAVPSTTYLEVDVATHRLGCLGEIRAEGREGLSVTLHRLP